MKLLFALLVLALAVVLVYGDSANASSLFTAFALQSFSPSTVIQAGFGCGIENGRFVCGQAKGNHDQSNHNKKRHQGIGTNNQGDHTNSNNDQGNHKKKKKQKGKDVGSQGERSCPTGYVVLDKPNKCGSFCEPKEGDPCAKAEAPATPKQICCSATAIDRDNNNRTVRPAGCGATQALAESQLNTAASINHWDIQGAISCAPQ